MGITKGDPDWDLRDLYFRHPTERLLFRWNHKTRTVHSRPIGCPENPRTYPFTDKYFNDAILGGDEISMMDYLRAGE